jgi:hypothetical protein
MGLRRLRTRAIVPAQVGTDRAPFVFAYLDKNGAQQHMSLAIWQATDGGVYLLGKRGYTSFVRSEAELYIPFGNISDCPSA